MEGVDTKILESKLRRLAFFTFFLAVFLSFVYPVSGADTPWHIKTGEYILTNGTIPMSSDPFSFATGKIPFIGQFILSQNWIAQVLFFVIYKSMGPIGLVLTRAVVFTMIISVIWYLIYRRKGFLTSVLAAAAAAFLLCIHFSMIRPQIFTFLFSALAVLIMEKYRDSESVKWLFPLPFIMVLWANMHGGFVYGVVLILVYLSGAAVEFIIRDRISLQENGHGHVRHLKFLFTFGLLSILFSLVNPNTYKAFVYTFMTQTPGYSVHNLYSEMILEYMSPPALLRTDPVLFYTYAVSVSCAFIMAAVFIGRRQPTQLLLALFAVIPALLAIRYIPLFTIVAFPLIAHMPRAELREPPYLLKIGIRGAVIAFCSFLAISSNPFTSRTILTFNDSFHYPVRAANFLMQNEIEGNIFASYNTAAFILFRCFPSSKIYLDSRFIDVERIFRGLEIEGQADPPSEILMDISRLLPGGVIPPEFRGSGDRTVSDKHRQDTKLKERLDKINAEILVHEAIYRSGQIYPFVFKLAREDAWKLIYVDGTIMIFVRDKPKFRDIIARYQLPKSLIYDEILEECRRVGPYAKHYYSSSALALLLKGTADQDTSLLIERALSRSHKDFIANYSKDLFLRVTQGNRR